MNFIPSLLRFLEYVLSMVTVVGDVHRTVFLYRTVLWNWDVSRGSGDLYPATVSQEGVYGITADVVVLQDHRA
jgi:hypothetical protein